MPKGKFTPYTPAEEVYIIEQYLNIPVKRIADHTNSSYGRVMRFLAKNNLKIPRQLVEKRKKDSYKKKGSVPFNKGKKQKDYMTPEMIDRTRVTRFKKGSKPHNYKSGEFLSKDGYIVLSIGESKQRLKHLFLWEQQHGKLPKGHCLACKTNNITNCHPSNWELISRAENLLRNSKHNYPPQVIKTMALTSRLKQSIKKLQENEQ